MESMWVNVGDRTAINTVPGSGLGGGSLGLLLGVCTLQILMNPAMSIIRAMPISNTAHQ